MANLGARNITSGDTRRYEVDYSDFLRGAGAVGTLTSPTVTVSSGATSTVGTGASAPSISVDGDRLYFYLTGGTVNEQFTVSLQVKDTQGETVNDTLSFTVVSP